VEIKRYRDAESFPFGHLTIRDMTPESVAPIAFSEVEVPIGADNPPYAARGKDKVYIGVAGEIEFNVDGETVRVRRGDVLAVGSDESYSYHNGGYEMGRLFLIQLPPGSEMDRAS
jgi:mannose-6-phosphate isomerase-like protein (cupin superfamily)